MKVGVRNALAFLAMLLMLAAAFAIGSYRSYLNEKLQVELALGSLNDVLTSRVEMGNNLLTVAQRHLDREDPLLVTVRADIAKLDASLSLDTRAAANEELTVHSGRLLDTLAGLPSVLEDKRDLGYVSGLLPRGFEQTAQWADAGKYNSAARQFNERLSTRLNGKIAGLLGIEPAEVFEGGPGL